MDEFDNDLIDDITIVLHVGDMYDDRLFVEKPRHVVESGTTTVHLIDLIKKARACCHARKGHLITPDDILAAMQMNHFNVLVYKQ